MHLGIKLHRYIPGTYSDYNQLKTLPSLFGFFVVWSSLSVDGVVAPVVGAGAVPLPSAALEGSLSSVVGLLSEGFAWFFIVSISSQVLVLSNEP